MKKILIGIAIFVVLVIAATAVVFTSAKEITIEDAGVDSVSEISLSGLTINGYVDVYNGGFIAAGVDNITYSVTIDDVEGVLGSGVLQGSLIKPKTTERFPFHIRVSWVPSIETALDLLLTNSTYANLEGVVNVAGVAGVRVALPFSARVNLKGYLEQFAVYAPEIIPDEAVGVIGEVIDYVVNNTENVVDYVSGLIS